MGGRVSSGRTAVERSEREFVVTRTFDAPARLVFDAWTKPGTVTTVTFEENDGRTLSVLQERYPSKEALDQAFVGMEDAMPEQFEQLAELLLILDAKV